MTTTLAQQLRDVYDRLWIYREDVTADDAGAIYEAIRALAVIESHCEPRKATADEPADQLWLCNVCGRRSDKEHKTCPWIGCNGTLEPTA